MNFTQNTEIVEHDDGIEKVKELVDITSPKVLCCDFDTLIYWVLVEKNEDGSNRELIEEDLPYLEGKLNEMVTKIINKIESYFTLSKTYIFLRGKDNFRKKLYPAYKANRPEKHPLVNNLYKYFVDTFNAIEVNGYEAEDACATVGWKLKENCIIAFVDHDLLEIPNCIMYNYKQDKFFIQSEADSLWEKYSKLNISEQGDNANFTPQYGIKKFLRDFNKDMTIEEYEKQSFETYIWCWSEKSKIKNKIHRTPNIEKATEMFNIAKQVLWLKQVEVNES